MLLISTVWHRNVVSCSMTLARHMHRSDMLENLVASWRVPVLRAVVFVVNSVVFAMSVVHFAARSLCCRGAARQANASAACSQEFYAKLQHNNQRFSASWHELNGLRLSMTHAF